MTGLVLSAVVASVGSLLLGQGVLALCGAREWSWAAPAVGFSLLLLLAVPGDVVPGRLTTVGVVSAVAVATCAVWMLRHPAHRPDAGGLTSCVLVVFAVASPFLAAERVGTLGIIVDNDMASHLSIASNYGCCIGAHSIGGYPLGPHALAAEISAALHIRLDQAFAGITIAVPILTAWASQMALDAARWPARVLVATVTGVPFLVAAYVGEGSFKEPMQALFVLTLALWLAGRGRLVGRGRWIAAAVVIAGILSVYSLPGLLWPAAVAGIIWGAQAAQAARRRRAREWLRRVGDQVPGVALAGLLLAIILAPQLHRLAIFLGSPSANLAAGNLGNLLGPLPWREALGVWNSADFRLVSPPGPRLDLAFGFVLGLVALGGFRLTRRREWQLPLAALVTIAVWAYLDHTQSPYIAAKGLVVASPLLLLVAALGVVDVRIPVAGTARRLRLLAIIQAAAGALLLVGVSASAADALLHSYVAPTAHLVELRRSILPRVRGQRVLYLGDDDFIHFDLPDTSVKLEAVGAPHPLPLRVTKHWQPNVSAIDFDSVTAQQLDRFPWVITTRDAAGSSPPNGLRLVVVTRDYELWRRVGLVEPRGVLPTETWGPGAVLDCRSPLGRRLADSGGEARIRPTPIRIPGGVVSAGGSLVLSLRLAAGDWNIEAAYVSPLDLRIDAEDQHFSLPALMDRAGPRWPIGTVHVPTGRIVAFRITERRTLLHDQPLDPFLRWLYATPALPGHTVALRDACGRYVDWYELNRPAGTGS